MDGNSGKRLDRVALRSVPFPKANHETRRQS
jgi:hypothetical protein